MKTFKTGATIEQYQQNTNILGHQLHESSWQKGQKLLVSKRNDILRGDIDEEDEARSSPQKRKKGNNKKQIIEEFQKAVQEGAVTGGGRGAEEGAEVGKSLKEVLEEREEQLKDIEQFQGNLKYDIIVYVFQI